MKKRKISEELTSFVAAHIHSVHTLEVLSLLLNEQTRPVTVHEVHAQVKSSVGAAQQSLIELAACGLATSKDDEQLTFQYAPKSVALDHFTAELVATYAKRRTAVIELIYSRPTRTARAFSRSLASEGCPTDENSS